MEQIRIHQKDFHIYIEEQFILQRIAELASAITRDFEGTQPLFVAVLNGSFIFAADLIKQISFPC